MISLFALIACMFVSWFNHWFGFPLFSPILASFNPYVISDNNMGKGLCWNPPRIRGPCLSTLTQIVSNFSSHLIYYLVSICQPSKAEDHNTVNHVTGLAQHQVLLLSYWCSDELFFIPIWPTTRSNFILTTTWVFLVEQCLKKNQQNPFSTFQVWA